MNNVDNKDYTKVGVSYTTQTLTVPEIKVKSIGPHVVMPKSWEKIQNPRAYTQDEQEAFINLWLKDLIHKWTVIKLPPSIDTIENRLTRLTQDIVNGLDNGNEYIPGFKLISKLNECDQKYLESIGSNWWPVNPLEISKSLNEIKQKINYHHPRTCTSFNFDKTFNKPDEGPYTKLNKYRSLQNIEPLKYYEGEYTKDQLNDLLAENEAKIKKLLINIDNAIKFMFKDIV